jgi:hypothetical protein
LSPSITGSYQFRVTSDNAVRLWIDNTIVLDSREETSGSRVSETMVLESSKQYNIVLEYAHFTGSASLMIEQSINAGGFTSIPMNTISSLYNPSK